MIKEIYGKKIGMTQLFDPEGNLLAVTLLEVEPVYLLEKVDYPTKSRIRIGCFKLSEKKASKLKRSLAGYFSKLGVQPHKLLKEVAFPAGTDFGFLSGKARTELDQKSAEPVEGQATQVNESQSEPSDKRLVGVDIFKEGDLVDVRAKTKGKGFTGGMKRYGWRGQPSSHGSTSHRRVGSIGASAYPSRVMKGTHMPGHMGNKFRTTKNLRVIKVDKEKSIIFLFGCVPGARGAVVRLKKIG